jgi:hypothetical protein
MVLEDNASEIRLRPHCVVTASEREQEGFAAVGPLGGYSLGREHQMQLDTTIYYTPYVGDRHLWFNLVE